MKVPLRSSLCHLRLLWSLRPGVVAIIAALTLSVGAAARGPVDDIRIDNFARVNDAYYRGAQPKGQDYADLKQLGVKTVINLIGDADLDQSEQSSVEQNGMRYVAIPMSTRKEPTPQQLAAFLSIVNNPESQPVYVHCVGGRHRTGVMTAVYRMMRDGITKDEAFREMKQFKYGPDFLHPEFKKFVQGYDIKKAAAAAAVLQQ